MEGGFEDVSIFGDLWLAVNIRFRAIGTVERVKLTVKLCLFLIMPWEFILRNYLCFGTGREEARADEAPDRHQA